MTLGKQEIKTGLNKNSGGGEKSQLLRALATIAEDQGLVPNSHVVVHRCL